MPSGLVSFKIPRLSPIVNGSYLMLTDNSRPLSSEIGAGTVATSALKSAATPGLSSLSTLT